MINNKIVESKLEDGFDDLKKNDYFVKKEHIDSPHDSVSELYGNNHDNGGDDDDDDAILQEVDLILSNEFADQLYIIQYPLRPPWRSYNDEKISEVRFKSCQKILEMQFGFTQSELNQQDREETTIVYDENGNIIEGLSRSIDYYTIRSSVVPLKSNYITGFYHDGKMYITPVKGVLQMRPSFHYIDETGDMSCKRKEDFKMALNASQNAGAKIESSNKDNTSTTGTSNDGTNNTSTNPNDMDNTLKPVKLKIKKKENERAMQMRLKSHSYLKQMEMEEPWKILEYISCDDLRAAKLFEKIAQPSMKEENCKFVATEKGKYLELLNPESVTKSHDSSVFTDDKTVQMDKKVQNLVPPPESMHLIQKMPLDKKVFALMQNTNIARFSQISLYLSDIVENKDQDGLAGPSKEELIIKELAKCALLLQGVWVIKSEYNYNGKMQAARNYILFRFAVADNIENFYIKKSELMKTCQLTADQTTSILSPICKLHYGKGWQLSAVVADREFQKCYPELNDKFNDWWLKNESQILKQVNSFVKK